MKLAHAKTILRACEKTEIRDDQCADVYWEKDETLVASGYFSDTRSVVCFTMFDEITRQEYIIAEFSGVEASTLKKICVDSMDAYRIPRIGSR